MKMNKFILTFTAFTMIILVSCRGGEKKEDSKKDNSKDKGAAPGAPAEEFIYSYDSTTTKIKWIAYKFTGKTPVEGTFESVLVSGTNSGPSATGVLIGSEFIIPVNSLQTGDEAKNKNIIEDFFANTTSQTAISIFGKVTAMTENSVTILLNFVVEKEITLECKWEGEKVTATGVLSLEEFEAMGAVKKLNKKCKKNHTGEDGVTKMWPEVTLMIETTLKKEAVE